MFFSLILIAATSHALCLVPGQQKPSDCHMVKANIDGVPVMVPNAPDNPMGFVEVSCAREISAAGSSQCFEVQHCQVRGADSCRLVLQEQHSKPSNALGKVRVRTGAPSCSPSKKLYLDRVGKKDLCGPL